MLNLLGSRRMGPIRVQLAIENLLNAEWNEAQFDTESRLRGEPSAVSELHFTPGSPRTLRVGVGILF